MSLRDMLRPVGHPIMEAYRAIKDRFRKQRSWKYLLHWKNYRGSNHNKLKIAFIMQSNTMWDKMAYIFEMASAREDMEATGLVVPMFSEWDIDFFSCGNECKRFEYGAEKEYFHNKYDNAIDYVNPDGTLLDLEKMGFDYIVYQRPYEDLLPKPLRAQNVARYSKTCYIPYSFEGAVMLESYALQQKDFFQSMYYYFTSTEKMAKIFSEYKDYNEFVENELVHYMYIGCPSLENVINIIDDTHINIANDGVILWTPRWGYSKSLGGSHFFEYREVISNIKKQFAFEDIWIRPHPLMFKKLIYNHLMTDQECSEYKKRISQQGIKLDDNSNVLDTLKHTKLLITDFSSIIAEFFLANIPIVYCDSPIVKLSESYKRILSTEYIVHNEKELMDTVSTILLYGDHKGKERIKEIKRFKEEHEGAAKRILDELYNDFKRTHSISC